MRCQTGAPAATPLNLIVRRRQHVSVVADTFPDFSSIPCRPFHPCRTRGLRVLASAHGQAEASVRWADVARIQAYKLDLLTTDCICLLFEFAPGRAPVQVSEEWSGFEDLFGPLAARFPAIPESWYADIMTPAFAMNRTVLFEIPGLTARMTPDDTTRAPAPALQMKDS